MSFSFAGAEGQVSELPAVCSGPRRASRTRATATVSVVFPLWGSAHPPPPMSLSCLLQHPAGSEKTPLHVSQK